MLEGFQLLAYLLVVVAAALFYHKLKYANTPLSSIFLLSFSAKVIGGLFFGAVYVFYYKGGDTLNYYHDCKVMFNAFLNDPLAALKITFLPISDYSYDTHIYYSKMWYDRDPASFMVIRFFGVLNFIGLNSFWSTTLLTSCLSFYFMWKLYIALIRLYPVAYKKLSIAILFMPSLFFWGSGIMKDTLTISFFAIILVQLISIHRNKISMTGILIAVAFFYFTLLTKPYIAACFIPALVVYLVIRFKNIVPNKSLRKIITPFFLITTAISSIIVLNTMGDYLGKYSLDNFEQTIETYGWWHGHVVRYHQGGQGSYYSLGFEAGGGITGLLAKFPLAINVSLFRPYLWEVKNLVMLLTALESFFVLITTFMIIKKHKLSIVLNYAFSNPLVSFCVVYSFLFLFAVGLASNNFGALARYKIPGLAAYMVALYLIDYGISLKKEKGIMLR